MAYPTFEQRYATSTKNPGGKSVKANITITESTRNQKRANQNNKYAKEKLDDKC